MICSSRYAVLPVDVAHEDTIIVILTTIYELPQVTSDKSRIYKLIRVLVVGVLNYPYISQYG